MVKKKKKKNPPARWEAQVQFLGWKDPLEKTMTTYSSILAWRIFRNRWAWVCCRKGDPFQGLKAGSCLTLRNELSKETHLLTKQEILLGRGAQAESSRVKEPRRTILPRGLQSRVLWWMDKFLGCFWSFILSPPWWHTHCSAKMDASEKYSGRWLDTWCHLLTFPQLFQLVVAY